MTPNSNQQQLSLVPAPATPRAADMLPLDRMVIWWLRRRHARRTRRGGHDGYWAAAEICAEREQQWLMPRPRRAPRSLAAHTQQQRGSKPSALLTLPNELLLEIFRHVPRMRDCNSLRQTSRRLHLLFASDFERRTVAEHGASLGRWAVHHRDRDFLAPWLDRGLAVDTRNGYGETILLVAVKCGNEGVARLLLDRGADVNACDRSGSSVLYWAIMTGKAANVRLVLAAGGDANGSARGRWTLLHSAVLTRDDEIVRLLLRHGAQPYTVSLGITPLEFAEQNNWAGMAKCIEEHPLPWGARGDWDRLAGAQQ